MSAAYRDPSDSIRARIETLRAEIVSREARLTEAFVAALPVEDAAGLSKLRRAASAEADTLEDLARVETLLETYRAALDEMIAHAPAIEAAYRAFPRTVPLPARARFELSAIWRHEDRPTLRALLLPLDAEASIKDDGALSQVAHFHTDAGPFVLRVEALEAEFLYSLATSVPLGMPRVVLKPETFADGFLKALRVRRDTRVGDDTVDGLFMIDASPEASLRVLTREVRAALLSVAYFDIPTLVIGGGAATVTFRFDLSPKCVNAAVRLLGSIRVLPVDVQFLREG